MSMTLSDEHKAALAQGRYEAKVVRHYLKALGKRDGRTASPEVIQERIEKIEARIEEEPSPMKRLQLHAEKSKLQARLAGIDTEDTEPLEKEFIAVAANFSKRRGIPYSAWREEGVSVQVLQEAGVAR